MLKLIPVLIIGAIFCCAGRADSLAYTVGASGSETTYSFTLTNSGATGGTIFDLFVSTPTPISNVDTSDFGIPSGWGDSNGGLLFYGPNTDPSNSFVEWAADFSGAYDVQIGDSISGFSVSTLLPITGSILFSLNGADTFVPAQQIQASPEPLSAAVTGIGMLLVALLVSLSRASAFRGGLRRIALKTDPNG